MFVIIGNYRRNKDTSTWLGNKLREEPLKLFIRIESYFKKHMFIIFTLNRLWAYGKKNTKGTNQKSLKLKLYSTFDLQLPSFPSRS